MTYVWLGAGEPTTEFTAWCDLQDTIAARQVALLDAIARLRVIENAGRNNAGLRGATAWTQPQRIMVLDAIADLAQGLRWLAQQQVNVGDPAD